MADAIDQFIDNLQNQIFDETRKAYGELGFQRWRNPKYRGAMEDADGHGRVCGTCGDTMQIFLKFGNGRVREASYITDGCGASTVCGSLAAELARGKSPEELADFHGQWILDMLGVFPKEDQHCAHLAAETVVAALNDYMRKQIDSTKTGRGDG